MRETASERGRFLINSNSVRQSVLNGCVPNENVLNKSLKAIKSEYPQKIELDITVIISGKVFLFQNQIRKGGLHKSV